MRQKKIVILVTRGDVLGGAQVHVRDLVTDLSRDHEVTVAVGSTGIFSESLRQAGAHSVLVIADLAREINPIRDLLGLGRLIRHLRRIQPDLMHCHTAKAGFVGRLAAWWLQIPVFYTVHGWQYVHGISTFQRLAVYAVEFLCSRLTRKIITVSEFDRQYALQTRVCLPHKLVCIPNGIPYQSLTRRDTDSTTYRFLMIARFNPQKDHLTLLNALAGLYRYDWTLDLVGDGPLLAVIQQEAHRLGLLDRVQFAGQRADVSPYLALADALLLCSHWEGLPLVLLEGLRAGLPLVATNVGGVAEIVQPEQTGLLVPEKDIVALRLALEKLLLNPQWGREMGQNGRKLFENQYTLDQMMQKLRNEFLRLPNAESGQSANVWPGKSS